MNIYRCSYILLEHNNIESVFFIRALDAETASVNSEKIFNSHLVSHKIPSATYSKKIEQATEEDVENYKLYMSQRSKQKKDLN